MKRREFCTTLSIGLGGLAGLPALAQGARALDFQLLGFALGIHVPAMAAIREILPSMPGYAEPKTARINQIQVVTQTMVGGTADIGESDPPTVLAATEAGGPLRIVGKPYDSTSLVMVVNADKVKDFADLAKPDIRSAIGARGDITHVMLVAPLLRRGLDVEKMNIVELPGSGTRVNALVSGKIEAASLHFDQVAAIADKGNFRTLLEPWKELPGWANEVWVVRADWLRRPENERALVDFLKSTLIAYRRANEDFDWYLERFRKYVTLPDAAKTTPEHLRPIWTRLKDEVRAWPRDAGFTVGQFRDLLPSYKAADAIRGTAKLDEVVEPKYLQQALKELG
jgi:ABC-type nitrate/sulfonate/bicarbonate transport system substrate-binding protein